MYSWGRNILRWKFIKLTLTPPTSYLIFYNTGQTKFKQSLSAYLIVSPAHFSSSINCFVDGPRRHCLFSGFLPNEALRVHFAHFSLNLISNRTNDQYSIYLMYSICKQSTWCDCDHLTLKYTNFDLIPKYKSYQYSVRIHNLLYMDNVSFCRYE